ncbi:endonuclease/exonuclease/phosphatase family protein [Arcanobacterium hippocoleae]
MEKTETPRINVLTYNTKGGATSAADIAEVMLENHINAAVLPETSTQQGAEIREVLKAAGEEFQQFDTKTSKWEPAFSSTVLLISTKLGTYKEMNLSELTGEIPAAAQKTDSGDILPEQAAQFMQFSRFSIVGAEPSGSNSKLPAFYGVHPIAPLPKLMPRWKAEITKTYGICKQERSFILAGDFNSTADHQEALGIDCYDSVKAAGTAGLGTWPAKFPVWLAAPIDRVLSGGNGYRGALAKIVKIGKSDHAGIAVQLRAHDLATASGKKPGESGRAGRLESE